MCRLPPSLVLRTHKKVTITITTTMYLLPPGMNIVGVCRLPVYFCDHRWILPLFSPSLRTTGGQYIHRCASLVARTISYPYCRHAVATRTEKPGADATVQSLPVTWGYKRKGDIVVVWLARRAAGSNRVVPAWRCFCILRTAQSGSNSSLGTPPPTMPLPSTTPT